MLSAVKPTIIMLILGKINQISVCLAVALRLKLIWKKIVINHLVNSPFKVEVVSVLHPEVQVTKKKKKKKKTHTPHTRTSSTTLSKLNPEAEKTAKLWFFPLSRICSNGFSRQKLGIEIEKAF